MIRRCPRYVPGPYVIDALGSIRLRLAPINVSHRREVNHDAGTSHGVEHGIAIGYVESIPPETDGIGQKPPQGSADLSLTACYENDGMLSQSKGGLARSRSLSTGSVTPQSMESVTSSQLTPNSSLESYSCVTQ